MDKKIILDEYEQEIEDNIGKYTTVKNLKEEIANIKEAARNHSVRKKSITIRLSEIDLEEIKIRASKIGIPYQTYIGMVIHKDATSI
jgi:predicted DNA binding CopG/RHH family protein